MKRESLRRLQARSWSRYPDFVHASLHARLADFAGWQTDSIAGNGSNEASARPARTILLMSALREIFA
jgi:histidinol-phosphate/aromatic aminotransferase/cobyric acid decarboxylase-like protein